MNNKFFQESTNAYIVSYNTAMEMMHNPTAAAQIATSVTMTYMMMRKAEMKQEQQHQEIGLNILNAIVSATAKQGSQDDGADSEKKETE